MLTPERKQRTHSAQQKRLILQGKEPDMDEATRKSTQVLISEALRHVYDPELGVNVIDLGLVYDVEVNEGGHVIIDMTLTTPGCPMHESLSEGVGAALQEIPGITSGEVRLVWEPAWDPSHMTNEGRRLLGFE
jgi:metal-sulfur cluster biosynthetic enzyme